MSVSYRNLSQETISNANTISYRLIEKALAMRCESYLAQIKAQVLTDTIFEIDHSKKVLSAMNSRLAREIHERKLIEKQLRAAKQEAEEATRLKEKFVALVSHDLKNPISAIIFYLRKLEEDTALPDPSKRLLKNGLTACYGMDTLISEVLNLSRIKNGTIVPQCRQFDLHHLVGRLLNNIIFAVKEKGIMMMNEIPKNKLLFADSELMAEVLSNLLSNAIKFCRPGDSVRIYLPQGEHFTIGISDTGIGIKPALMHQLFQYEQKTSTVGTAGEVGTGFGLPLARDIIQAHGGDLLVIATSDKGTTFHIDLPIPEAANPPKPLEAEKCQKRLF